MKIQEKNWMNKLQYVKEKEKIEKLRKSYVRCWENDSFENLVAKEFLISIKYVTFYTYHRSKKKKKETFNVIGSVE